MRRVVLGGALWLAALAAGACATRADSGAERGASSSGEAPSGDVAAHGSTGAHGAAGASVPVAIPGHEGGKRGRCASCHSAEERSRPRWKEIVGQLGHDVKGMLEKRTTCNCCHLGEVTGFGEPFEARCLDCHDDIRVTIPKMGSQHCVSCHGFGPDGPADMIQRAWECQTCHAERQGGSGAIDVHGGEDCADCHRPHEQPWTLPRQCTDCHARQETVRHGDTGSRGTQVCADCHAPHEQAGGAAERCASCHEKETPGLVKTARFEGHDACTTCHAPHRFDAAGVTGCGTCHQGKRTMSGRGQKEHAACQSCHSPHDVRGSAQGSCRGCHDKVTSDHPDPKGTSCTTCHDPHPSKTETGTAILAAAAGCTACHTTVRHQAGEHAELACNKCHATHREGSAPAGCEGCHADEAARTALTPKHEDCTGCHTGNAHRPHTNTGACASCHAAEQASAPAGHADCAKCHDSHSGKRPATATCQGCHAPQATKAVALGHGECASCHRPHGPSGPASPPACATCHSTKELPALHALSGHQACASCHGDAHAPPRGDRATCLDCHSSQQDHQKDAASCVGCHRFNGD